MNGNHVIQKVVENLGDDIDFVIDAVSSSDAVARLSRCEPERLLLLGWNLSLAALQACVCEHA